jgi:hypothetical protein
MRATMENRASNTPQPPPPGDHRQSFLHAKRAHTDTIEAIGSEAMATDCRLTTHSLHCSLIMIRSIRLPGGRLGPAGCGGGRREEEEEGVNAEAGPRQLHRRMVRALLTTAFLLSRKGQIKAW